MTAERCFGATGSVAKSRYLHKVNNMVRAVEAESPGVSGIDHFSVQSKLAVLSGELHRAGNPTRRPPSASPSSSPGRLRPPPNKIFFSRNDQVRLARPRAIDFSKQQKSYVSCTELDPTIA